MQAIQTERPFDLSNKSEVIRRRGLIQDAASLMAKMISDGDMVKAECPVTHRFTKGLYLREIFMPKGSRVIGKIHAAEHFNVVLTGKVTVITVDGKEEITAPHTFISKAGIQKVVIVHEDCTWQTLHVTDKTSIDEIEKEVIVDSYDKICGNEVIKLEGLL